ncbi:hypothetical protein [Syntrophomonas palmitatica]|uniref:hypothetical protein n=1 Tax=Syntrophomonas palmitatica TaxID=402877 RepID=UPI0006D18FE0|nr:hypothetical protein [Syntrophomonas palmitatica]
MNILRSGLIRVLLLAVCIGMLAWMPTREFLKITFMIGIPFVFALGFMVRRKPYSLAWIVSLFVMLAAAGLYVYLLTDLPERIETRRIITQGGTLVPKANMTRLLMNTRNLRHWDAPPK